MRTTILLFLFPLWLSAQEKINYDHCNCYDQFESITPDLNGKYARFCNGKKVEEGEFTNGNKNGGWTLWSLKGQVLEQATYNNGLLNGQFQLFYGKGTTKFSGTFVNGKGVGQWIYYNSKGKIIKIGKYENGKPIGIWQVYDEKGKKVISSFNYDNYTSIVNSDESYYLDNGAIIENDFNGQFFILRYPAKFVTRNEQPLGGYKLARDFFSLYVSIPEVFWDTYTNYHYKAEFTFNNNSSESIKLLALSPGNWDVSKEVLLPYLIVTNPTEKIRRIEHKEIAIRLLESKILETLHIMGPWVNAAGTRKVEIVVAYIVNDIKNLDGR